MKHILIILLFSIFLPTFCSAQKELFVRDILSNTIAFPSNALEMPSIMEQSQKTVFSNSEGILESQICMDTSEVIVQIGDSLYAYNIDNDLYNLLGKVIHGITGSFDVIREPVPILVTTAFWDTIYVNDGTGWINTTHHANNDFELIHIGAGRKTAYFMGKGLWFYNRVSNPVLIRPNINSTMADLVVDENERVWILTGKNFPIADTLRLIDSTGTSICDFPFKNPINTYNGYGMFIKNGRMYVGFGPYNLSFPNSIVPLIFETPFVHFGAPITFKPDYGIDLGSCEKWVRYPDCGIVSNQDISEVTPVSIYPNPFSEELNIDFNLHDNLQVIFYNALGMKIAEQQGANQTFLSTANWEKGVYYCIIQQDGIMLKAIKLVKTHLPE